MMLKSGVDWNEYSSLGPDKAAEKVAAMLMETWGKRPGLAALMAENERLTYERDRDQASRRWHMQKRRLAEADLAAARAEMAEKERDCARGA